MQFRGKKPVTFLPKYPADHHQTLVSMERMSRTGPSVYLRLTVYTYGITYIPYIQLHESYLIEIMITQS
jgi:hypothetical protein